MAELIETDAGPDGHDSPYLTKEGAVDIYGHDGKPAVSIIKTYHY